eukprot:GHVS01097159.1.p1 GENE.GHVS01097159.1~~GHVS01097159.1.p1  ORF type:complete len:380 (-),score=65.24 GHVS01097159.1:131-1270(-)
MSFLSPRLRASFERVLEGGEEARPLPPMEAAGVGGTQPVLDESREEWEDAEEGLEEEKEEEGMGCVHYRRKCQVIAPCCGEQFWCRHCHNEIKNTQEKDPKKAHELDRRSIREVVCMVCLTRQPPSRNCSSCGEEFAQYFCSVCNFWDNAGLSKHVFHCDDCGICRVGGRENFFHCEKCQSCYSNELKERHVCVEGAMKNPCPICLEDMFSSVKTVVVLDQCGHTMHKECHRTLRTTPAMSLQAIRCPLCGKGMSDNKVVWDEIERSIEMNPLPDNIRRTARISCNDCSSKSSCDWHVIGMKCAECGGYNTAEIDPPVEQEGAGQGGGVVEVEAQPVVVAEAQPVVVVEAQPVVVVEAQPVVVAEAEVRTEEEDEWTDE